MVTPTGNADPAGSPLVCAITTPAQLSVAAGGVQLAIALHNPALLFNKIFGGQYENTGTSTSVTVTVNEHTLVLPYASVAVYEMVVVPIGKLDPLAAPNVCNTVTPAQLSDAAGAGQLTTAPHTPGLFVVIMFEGHDVNIGAWLSVTVTKKLQVAVFPLASVAV